MSVDSVANNDGDDDIAQQLAAWDELIDRGAAPPAAVNSDSPQLSVRLLRGLKTLEHLQHIRRRPGSQSIDASSIRGSADASHDTTTWKGIFTDSDGKYLQLGRFRIVRELGRGGFGVVFLAFDPVLHRQVALKVPRMEVLSDSALRNRFFAEARVAAGLDHPNIVPVHDAGQVGPVCFIAYAFCPGPTLAEWLHHHKEAIRTPEAAELVWTLADAVHCAHERGVLHRDLKPSNVILVEHRSSADSDIAPAVAAENDGIENGTPGTTISSSTQALSSLVPKITDFGLAKVMEHDSGLTQSGAIVGTPSYMSPEQAAGRQELERSTDVYGLGAMLYELISGRPPFRGETPLETLHQVMSMEPVSLRRLRDRMPRDLETICSKCLQKDPKARYATALDLRDDLRRFLNHEPIHARPVGRVARTLRWCRRRPLVSALATALFVLTVLSLTTILANWWQLRATVAALNVARETELQQKELADATIYFQSISLARHLWQANRTSQARKLLDDTDPNRREWEWNYVDHLMKTTLASLPGHRQTATDVRISPDGKWIASSAGTWLSADPGEVRLWDANTGRSRHVWKVDDGPVWKVAFVNDGRQLAASSSAWRREAGPSVSVWDTENGKLVTQLPVEYVFGLAASPTGHWLAAALASGTIAVFDTRSWQLHAELTGHTDNVFGLAFHPDGRRLVSGGRDHTVRVWDVETGQALLDPIAAPSDVRCVDASPDGQHFAAGDWKCNVTVWDIASGEVTTAYHGHREPVFAVRFSPDGTQVASGGSDREIHIWNLADGRTERILRGEDGIVHGLAYHRNGQLLLSCGSQQDLHVWDPKARPENEPLNDLLNIPMDACFDPTTDQLLMQVGVGSSRTRNMVMMNLRTNGGIVETRTFEGHTADIISVNTSQDGRRLASLSHDGMTRLWDSHSRACLHEWQTPDPTCLAMTKDGSRVATGLRDGKVQVWRSADGRLDGEFADSASSVVCLAFSQDARFLAIARAASPVLVCRLSDGRPLARMEVGSSEPSSLVFSADGEFIAVGTRDGQVHLFQGAPWESGPELRSPLRTLTGHTDQVRAISFSADGKRLLSGSDDASAKLWDTASGMEAITLVAGSGAIQNVHFSPSGKTILTQSGISHLWRTQEPPIQRVFSP